MRYCRVKYEAGSAILNGAGGMAASLEHYWSEPGAACFSPGAGLAMQWI